MHGGGGGVPKMALALFYMSGAKPESAGASLPFLLTVQRSLRPSGDIGLREE